MATFYVPIENVSLPGDDPTRWHMLVVEETSPVDAMMLGAAYANALPREASRGTPRARYTVWAAVRDMPTFAYMQELRDSMSDLKGVRMRYKRGDRRIPGYVG